MNSGFDTVRVENEKLLKLQDNLGWDQARLKAADHKAKVFNSLLNFVLNQEAEDVEIIYEEKRYEAFWHILGYANMEYKRKKEYQLNVDAIVKGVEIVGKDFGVERKMLKLSAIETCEENQKEEFLIDANLDTKGDFSKYLKYPAVSISTTAELQEKDAFIAELKTSSSQLVKRMLLKLVNPVESLEILKEEIVISELSLYFHPLYTFEFYWKAKDKKALVSFDGVTGEVYAKAAKIGDTLKNTFNKDDLFEFGKEIAQNIVPGGGLAVMLGKKMLEISKKK